MPLKFDLIQLACEARERAYAPYSNFKVGAVVMGQSGKTYTGCNIENASFGLSNCAERTAIFKAISEGEKQLDAIVVATDEPELTMPCGACRQVMLEFGINQVIIANTHGQYLELTLEELMPRPFSLIREHGSE